LRNEATWAPAQQRILRDALRPGHESGDAANSGDYLPSTHIHLSPPPYIGA